MKEEPLHLLNKKSSYLVFVTTLLLSLFLILGGMLAAMPISASQTQEGLDAGQISVSQAQPQPQTGPVIARSLITGTKVIAKPGLLDPTTDNVTLLQDYGSFGLYLVPRVKLNGLQNAKRNQLIPVDWMNTIEIGNYPLDTRAVNLDDIPPSLQITKPEGATLQLVHFVGPLKNEWLEAIKATGSIPVHYVANNAYLVWTDAEGRNQLDNLGKTGQFVQFSLPYQPYFKLGRTLLPRVTEADSSEEIVPTVIQLYQHDGLSETRSFIERRTISSLAPDQPILNYINVYAEIRVVDMADIARRPDVVWLGERVEPEMLDEVQAQIVAGNLSPDQSGADAPGYLAWLDSFGFSQDPNDYPIVDVVDDGIGNGAVNSGDATLHQFGISANVTRLAYVDNCTGATDGGGPDGHGHINTSIVGGYDTRAGFPFRDLDGYQRGQGINPYGRLAGTRIFGPDFSLSNCGGTETGLIKNSQDNGAQITSNSWGAPVNGDYDSASQAFDVGVRDADLSQPGNQAMIMIFAAGNDGPEGNTIGSPGTAKNVITVGASENNRPTDDNGNWIDGCGTGPTGANSTMDIIDFSSRGPAQGDRNKPEIVAPGTHIQGTASTNNNYSGTGVCDKFRPAGQTIFAASSGTSHSTPAVAGVTSLYYYWLQNAYGITPSPALMKAYLIAHPTYLTGVDANDNLPSNEQGYGMPNMGLAFDDTPRYIIDQTNIFDNSGETWSLNVHAADVNKPVRLVLAYTDAAGPAFGNPKINDLNLTAEIGDSIYRGNIFSGQWSTSGGTADTNNNYEAIFLPSGTTDPISVTVTAFNIAGDGIPNSGDDTDQDFALVCYNCTQQAPPQLVIAPASLSSIQVPDVQITQTLMISNLGGLDLAWNIDEDITVQASKVIQFAGPYDPVARAAPAQLGHSTPLYAPRAVATILLDEGFEEGVVPPTNWTQVISNTSQTWRLANFGHSGSFAAEIEYDEALIPQDEWLLSPEISVTLTDATLSLWSGSSLFWCRDINDNCDLEVWLVVGDVGGGDDIFVDKADDDWTASFTWSQSVFDLTSLLPDEPIRFGFRYVGLDGAQIALDDIILSGSEDGVCLTPESLPWLSLSPTNNTTISGANTQVDVTFDSTGLAVNDVLTGTLCLNSNDPDQVLLQIPVSLTVAEEIQPEPDQQTYYMPVLLKN